jgi:hypothetical protein
LYTCLIGFRHHALDGAAKRGRKPGLDLGAGIALVPQLNDRSHVGDDLGMVLADVADEVRLADRHRDGDQISAGVERELRVFQVRHQHRDLEVRDGACVFDHLGAVRHLRQRARGDERADLDLGKARGRQRVDPAALLRRRHDALDTLQPVARTDLADQDIDGHRNLL